MTPMELVEILNSIFTAIDGVVEACADVPEETGVHKGACGGGTAWLVAYSVLVALICGSARALIEHARIR